uniref:Uncharacterized protein n=1 Tax=Kalanchoe fedtschenkoi TaxID=63787 RepID=A0A7N0TT45_KALFE
MRGTNRISAGGRPTPFCVGLRRRRREQSRTEMALDLEDVRVSTSCVVKIFGAEYSVSVFFSFQGILHVYFHCGMLAGCKHCRAKGSLIM